MPYDTQRSGGGVGGPHRVNDARESAGTKPGSEKGMNVGSRRRSEVGGNNVSLSLAVGEDCGACCFSLGDSEFLRNSNFLHKLQGLSPEKVAVTACEKPVSDE